jgi:hypothetical protein
MLDGRQGFLGRPPRASAWPTIVQVSSPSDRPIEMVAARCQVAEAQRPERICSVLGWSEPEALGRRPASVVPSGHEVSSPISLAVTRTILIVDT